SLWRGVRGKGAEKVGVEPFGVVAGNVRRCTTNIARIETPALVLAQSLRCVLRAIGELCNCIGAETTLALEHSQQDGPRRICVHQEGARCTAPQPVIDQASDSRSAA